MNRFIFSRWNPVVTRYTAPSDSSVHNSSTEINSLWKYCTHWILISRFEIRNLSSFSKFLCGLVGLVLTEAGIPLLQLNGINTQGENIADCGGLKEAYIAYEHWMKRHGEEPYLPGINLNGRQMFWVSAAHIWCSKYRKEDLRQIVVTDEHSPDKFRVIGPMSNMQYFAKDFDCKVGSFMNPIHKCNVWWSFPSKSHRIVIFKSTWLLLSYKISEITLITLQRCKPNKTLAIAWKFPT